MHIRILKLTAPAALVCLVLAGCGSSGSNSSASSAGSNASSDIGSALSSASSEASSAAEGRVVEIDVASSGFQFTKSSATAQAGPVVLRSMNPQSVAHDISLKGNGIDLHGDQVSNGDVSQIVIPDLKPGTYTYYCSVPGHEAAGMKGTLTVS
jgi:plastocyanin